MLASKGSMFRDVKDAIWGSLTFSWSNNHNDRNEKLFHKKNGIFLDEKGPKLTNLSGVFVTRAYPSNVPNAEHCIYQNPFTDNPLDFSIIGLRREYVEKNKFSTMEGKKLSEVFNVFENCELPFPRATKYRASVAAGWRVACIEANPGSAIGLGGKPMRV